MNKTILKSISILILSGFICSVVFISYKVNAEEPDQKVIAEINKQIEAQRAKIDALTDKIKEYQTGLNANRQEKLTLQNQLMFIENQIAKINLEIELKEAEAKELSLGIEQVNLEISQTETEIDQEKDKLGEIIRVINRYEEKDHLSVLLAHESFSEFFDQVKYSNDLQKNLQKSLNRFKEAKQKLQEEEAKLNLKKEELSEILKKLEDNKNSLSEQKGSKNYLIQETQKSEKKFQTLVTDIKKEQAAANNQIIALERKLREELAKKGDKKYTDLQSSALIWPVDSRRITAYFHDTSYPFRHLFEHSGLDFGIGKGTPVRSAESGYVAKVELGTKWYGNYVMIIHGNNITTLYAHLSSVNVKPDQYVSRGQTIALSGNTGFSTGPHLHFEVRKNGVPVNPLTYLPK